MKFRNTLILVGLAVALFAAIRWYETKNLGTREEGMRKGRVLAFDRENIDGITLARGEDVVELEKRGARWEIVSPIQDRADSGSVEMLLNELEFLRAGDVIDLEGDGAKKRMKEFGVNRPKLRVKLRGKGAPGELGIGKETAVSGKSYARVGEEPRVHVIPSSLKEIVIRKAEDFRDRQLSDLDVGEIERVELAIGAGEIALERPAERWHLAKPLRARADDGRVADLIAKLATLPVQAFCGPAEKAMAVHGFEEPRATFRLYSENNTRPAVFEVGAPVPGKQGSLYLRYAGRGGFYEVPAPPVEAVLKTEPNDLRDRQLLRIQMDVVDRIEIRPAGRPPIALAREGEGWVIRDGEKRRPADPATVERMAAALQQRKIERFVAEAVTDTEVFGLEEPALTVTFSSYASENTPESEAGERPFLKLELGKIEEGLLYARLAEEPFVVAVGDDLLESIPAHASEWQMPEVFRFDPAQVVGLKVSRAGGQDFELAREPGGEWAIRQGAGVLDPVATQSLLNTLSTLRAVRWVGPETPERGLASPSTVVEYRLADRREGKLRISPQGPDGTRFAAATGLDGVCVLSGPDVSALEGELMKTPPPTPSPASPQAPAPPDAAAGEQPPRAR